ncbi:MAG: hypothetical protein ACRDT3_08580 [Glutamicibacter sp.]
MSSMSGWQFSFEDGHKLPVLDLDWTPIDTVVHQLALLQVQARGTGEVTAELQSCVAQLERLIMLALERGASLGQLGERTRVSQQDLARVRDTGRLYER